MTRLVSIIIPAYHAGRFLPVALAGVSSQTFADWELIVVEDGSHDETESIVTAFAADHPHRRVVYENLGQNHGVSAARNRAIAFAKGDFFAFLDADDVWLPDHLETCWRLMHKGSHFVISAFDILELETGQRSNIAPPSPEQLVAPIPHLLRTNFIQSSSTVVMTRAAWAKAGPFDTGLRVGEDLDVWLRAIAAYGLAHSGQVTCLYAKHARSAMANVCRVTEDRIKFLEKQRDQGVAPASIFGELLTEAHWSQARMNWRKRPVAALKSILSTFRLERNCV